MSIEAQWDLQAKASPRCVAVYPAFAASTSSSLQSSQQQPRSFTTNPLLDSHSQNSNRPPPPTTTSMVAAVVFGTDRGSFHYRTYSMLTKSSSPVDGSNTAAATFSLANPTLPTNAGAPTLSSGSNHPTSFQPHQQQIQLPLGVTPSAAAAAAATATRGTSMIHSSTSGSGSGIGSNVIPRHLFPMDFGSLPGPVVACIPLHLPPTSSSPLGTSNHHPPTSSRTASAVHATTTTTTAGAPYRNRKQHPPLPQQSHLNQQQQPTFLLLIDDGRGAAAAVATTTSATNASAAPSSSTPVTTSLENYSSQDTSLAALHTPSATSAYSSRIVKLSSPPTSSQPAGFQLRSSSSSSSQPPPSWGMQPQFTSSSASPLPRMACATYVPSSPSNNNNNHSGCLVYGVGRSIYTLSSEYWDSTTVSSTTQMISTSSKNTNTTTNHSMKTTIPTPYSKMIFPNHKIPPPGIRSGPDAMMVIGMNHNHQNSSGMVAIVAIGNTFYAIVGTSVHTTTGSIDDDDTSTIHEPTHPTHTRNIHAVSHNTTATTSNHTMIHDDQHHNSENVIKIISFQQSSQVYPVIVLNLYDRSLDPNWHSIFLASGRECAVVDVYVVGTDDGMNYYSNNATTTTTTTTHDGYSSSIHCSKPRNGIVTVTSPILSAASSYPYIVILQSDGLISIRSSSCLAISLRTIEVGQRPNDYFTIRTIHNSSNSMAGGSTNDVTSSFVSSSSSLSYIATTPYIVAVAYSGECKVIQCQPDTAQDLADRCMRHAIDAFGTNGFPRMELAEAINASFTATSYVNPNETSTSNSRILLKQYLEAVLGLTDFEGGGSSGWPTELLEGDVHHGAFATGGIGTATTTTAAGSTTTRGDGVARSRTDSRGASYFYYSGRGAVPNVVTSATPTALLTGTALLCLVCSQLVPVHSSLANRAAKVCSEKIGIVFDGTRQISKSAISVCELVAEKLLKEASSKFSLGSSASPTPIARVNRSAQSNAITDFLEASIWLLRSCGKHERAIEVAYERLQQQGHQQQTVASTSALSDGIGGTVVRGFWSQIKYESYTATHLSDIWSAGKDEGCQLVLSSPATRRLLERNPRLGLSVFTAMHPQNEAQWRSTSFRDDPLSHPGRVNDVLNLFKTIHPFVSTDKERSSVAQEGALNTLPLESGLAIAVSFVRSAIGISTGRPVNDDHHHYDSLPIDADLDNQIANIHDKLSLLLLEGTIVERSGGAVQPDAEDNELGQIYRSMLREFLQWPLAKIRPEEFMEALPSTFLQEKALVLGRLGQHEDALRILYGELNSLDLALAYCDHRYSRQKQQYYERNRTWQQQQQQHHQQNVSVYSDLDAADDFDMKGEDNAYVPLIRIALESHDTERGTATAIKVLALRRGAVDRTAALKLLPADVPVSAVARPFLIPALVESESQVRRMTVVSALLRSRYLRLKEKLTTAQLKAQANIHIVVSLKSLNLGDPIHSTKATRARTTSVTPGATMPYIEIIKHFFQRHLVIQAKVTNSPYSSHSSSSVAHYSDKMGEGSIHNRPVLSDVSFVVAESSEEEAIMPLLQVPIQLLPPTLTGCAWCVLSASPSNMDAPTAQLTCELRYSIQPSATTGVDTNFGFHTGTVLSRTFVEELQDIEIHAVHFLPKAH